MKRGLFKGLFAMVCALILDTTITYAQGIDSLESKIRNSLTTYYKSSPQEKIFLHTNKRIYAAGQTIWYKAYATAYGKPSQLSKILYVQLADKTGNVIVKNKLQVQNGTSHGNIDLPVNLASGWYRLTGFTAWMMNFEQDGFYHQDIYVQSLADTMASVPKNKTTPKYHIDFFPEGGDPIEGALCNIAFKATDDNGMPAKVNGTIQDNSGKTVATLATTHDGMGMFSLEGNAGRAYYADVRFPDGSGQKVSLPEFKKSGIAMQINTLPANEVEIKIAFSGDPQRYRNIVLAAFQNNGLINTYPLQLVKGTNVFGIKKADFSTGILRLTVFTADGLPQAERIVFVNKHDALHLELFADTLSYMPKSKAVLNLSVKDGSRLPVSGNFSVSVTDANAFNWGQDEDNIYTSLLMTSELRGFIYHPAYYFYGRNDTLQKQLDMVMLTNGWRHFKWDGIFNNKPAPLKYPVEKSQFIAGRIFGYHKPLDNKDETRIKLIIANEDSSKYIGYITPDSTGSFILRDFNHSGISEIYFEVANAKNHKQKLKVKFMKGLMDTIDLKRDTLRDVAGETPMMDKQFLSDALNEEKIFRGTGVLLNTIEVKGRKISPVDQLIKEHVNNFTADNAYTLDMVHNTFTSIDLVDYIKGRFPGLEISGNSQCAIFNYHGRNSFMATPDSLSVGGAYLPYFYMNESHIGFDDLKDIPLTDIALIRFFPPPVWFAPYNGGNVGAIVICTKKQGDDISTFKKEAFDRYSFKGYSITREFYSPDYGSKTADLHHDTRSTLYWNHDLNSDSSGEASFHFFNNDKTKKYRVIIQGIDANGRLGYLETEF
jgi:hypothetical protein